MRERIAISLGALTLALLVGLSVVFAREQNPAAPVSAEAAGTPAPAAPEPAGPTASEPAVPTASEPAVPSAEPAPAMALAADSIRGRLVYAEQGCEGCHSVQGVGSPRYPLDGVGSRRTPEQLRAWTLGLPAVADSLPPAMFRLKQAYQEVPADQLEALILFLVSLKGG